MSKPSQSFTALCTKVNGKLKIHDLAGFNDFVGLFGDGEDIDLTLETAARRRTSRQNRFFHGPILKAFMALGYGKQEAKDMLCLRFIPQEIHLLDGSIVRVPGHTSALSVEDFNLLIDDCIQLAAEQDQPIADAAEWREAQRQAARKSA